MSRENLDCQHLVFNTILKTFSNPEVEKNLSTTALLVDDLALTSVEIYYLGLLIESELAREKFRAFSDAQIMSWKTVSDIIRTVETVIKNT